MRLRALLMTAGLVACFVVLVFQSAQAKELTVSSRQELDYKQLKDKTTNFFGSVNKQLSVSNFLFGKPLFKSQNNTDDYEQVINNFFKTYPDLFQISLSDFRVEVEKPKNRNITQVHLFQRYQNIPVFGGEAIVTLNSSNEIVSYLGKYIPDITLDTSPKTTSAEIQSIVANDLQIDQITQEPRLFIFNKGVLTNVYEPTQLVWRLGTNGWVYFVNANTKEIVYKYLNSKNVLTRTIYTGEGGTPTLPGSLVISEGDDTSTIPDEDDTKRAYNYSEDVYNYYNNHFSLDSFDDVGAAMISTVNYDLVGLLGYSVGGIWCNSLIPGNEALCPTVDEIIFEDNFTVLDVTAHEWTHAVGDYAIHEDGTDIYGLTMSDQPGALNESYSDIFGVLVEAEYGDGLDWYIGEDLPTGSQYRSLAVPISSSPVQADSWSGYVSGGDAHYNSGIPNKAAYLIMREKSDGYETFNSIDVRGMGTDMAQQIFYYALRDELLTSTTFADNLNALLQTCLTLETIEIDTADCEPIYDAYTAIGVADGTTTFIESNFTIDSTSGYGPLTVNFDGTDSVSFGRNITDYSWDFGDGTTVSTGTTGTTSHTYTATGTLTATLTITDSDGQTDSETVSIEVTNPIDAIFSQTGDGTGAPATVSFDASGTTDQTGTIADYSWNFGDSSTSSGTSATVSHLYSTNGNYNVTLTVTNDAGYTDTYSHMVFVGTTSPTTVSGTIYNDTWTVARSPYLISGAVTIASGSTLTIDPGVVVKFLNTSSSLTVSGTLDAIGTSTEPIIFTSYKDDTSGGDTNVDGTATSPAAGDWYYSRIATGGVANLDYVTMQYGGYIGTSSDYAMLLIDDNATSVTVDHSTLQASQYYTLQMDPGSTSTISNTTIANTASQYAVYVTGGSTTLDSNIISATSSYGIYVSSASPVITNNTVANTSYGIYVTGTAALPSITNNTFTENYYPIYINQLNEGAVLSGNSGSGNTYDVIGLSYILGDVTLNNDNSLTYYTSYMTVTGNLTIDPGVVVKLRTGGSDSIRVSGSLDALGTVDEPIIFTSLYDDTYGGDTNNDVSATTPTAGDWPAIEFLSGSSGDWSNVIIQYGGYYSYGMVEIGSDTITISDSYFANAENNAIRITAAAPTVSNNIIIGSEESGIYLYSGNPTITDNLISGHGWYGIYISSGSPTLTSNSIQDNTLYGVYNQSSSNSVNAENNWWGDASGPYNSSNPTGTGNAVRYVDFTPWLTLDPDTDVTSPADVTLGIVRKDTWNQTVTLNWTNPTDTDFDHVQIDRTNVVTGATSTLTSTETRTQYTDTTPVYGSTYTYTLYACDTTGNCSSGVTTGNQFFLSPTPINVGLTPGNTTLTVNWSTSPALPGTVVGYKVYYGTAPDALSTIMDVGNVTTTTLTGLTNVTPYYVAVSVYNRRGMESAKTAIRVSRPHL